jgi:Uma2 family endonuclease
MAELALKELTVDEFLRWAEGTDERYELFSGHSVPMGPPGGQHSLLATALGGEIRSALRPRRPCRVYTEVGIFLPDRNDAFYVADLAATCVPLGQDGWIRDPFLIIEILSPSTTRSDFQSKAPDYRRIPSVKEILLIDSMSLFAEVLRRDGDRWITELVRGTNGMLSLDTVPLRIPIAELYDGVPLSDGEEQEAVR